jgi:hypothetical protein
MPSAPGAVGSEPHERELFVAGLTPFEMFDLHAGMLAEMVTESHDLGDEGEVLSNYAAEVCLIGLVAHFEAFCKHQFAAVVNICPALLEEFAERRQQCSVKLKDLVCLTADFERKIGFLIAEQHDFGSAKAINAIFGDLLSVTPLSKAEARKYDELLNARHLLVHHAGIYTIRYASEKLGREEFPQRLFMDSIVVSRRDYLHWHNFISKLVVKTVRATSGSLKKFIEHRGLILATGRTFAIEYLLLDIDISISEILRMKKEAVREN